MTNTRLYTILLAFISWTIPITGALAATPQEAQGGMASGEMAKGEMSKSEMSKSHSGMMNMATMMNEPHHQLTMAYKQNLENFAKALRQQAAKTTTVNSEFARDAVTEMKRSFDMMQQHHQDHMKTVDEKMKAHMSDMMKQMETQDSAIKAALDGLDKEAQNSAPDSKHISTFVDEILKNCDMSKMHGDRMHDKMGGPAKKPMN